MRRTPLTEFQAGDHYQGEDGGLYGGGQNSPAPALESRALEAANRIRPRAADGTIDPTGSVGFLSVGFSNAEDEFAEFIRLAGESGEMAPALRLINGAQAHMGCQAWAEADPDYGNPWSALAERVAAASIAPAQVQAAWIKMAPRAPQALGEFPRHAERTTTDLEYVRRRLGREFPNLQLAYFSSRIYAGYAGTGLNPEPYAYEEAFAVRRVVQRQFAAALEQAGADPPVGAVRPLALWGPYLWADGTTPRKADGLCWSREDFSADGTHPSGLGSAKVGRLLLDFFRDDVTARGWFCRAH